ncbi:MAG: hypothetical protein EP297_14595 [Gammaproteobacteria bacterium]|nr:MAG: hypothetical protein EP297_14595 [Gammaproteobacteria bacterium]
MKIQLLSDIHTESYPAEDIPSVMRTDADVLILAGDIGTGMNVAKWVAEQAARLEIPVIFVLGNHEFYHNDFLTFIDEIKTWFKENAPGVHLLECDTLILGGVRFLGTTLWTDYKAAEPEFTQIETMTNAESNWSDHLAISFNNSRRFLPNDALEAHKNSLDWLKHQLAIPFSGKTVVVTHHAPSNACERSNNTFNISSGCFQSQLDYLMGDGIDLWAFGHTHSNIDANIKGTRLVCNQAGFPQGRVTMFDPRKIIEV